MATEPSPSLLSQKRFLIWAALLVVVLVCLAIYFISTAGLERTQDAYVQGNIVQVTSQIGGTVVSIGADDTNAVKAGQSLVKLNPVDYQVELERAEAALATATRQARVQFHQADQLRAEVRQRQNDLTKAREDQHRRAQVADSGAVSGEEMQHTQDVLNNAREALEASSQQLQQRLAMTDGLTVSTHPDVLAASSRVKDAFIALHRTTVPAPVSGMVSRRTVQVGQHIAPGASLMSIVPLDQIWVDANFKESQLQHIRVGQSVTLTTDLLGGGVILHGKVSGLNAGTGSAFSLLPAQNATGNWIKVTQRVPVRIELDPADLKRHPLQIGLSVHASVDTKGYTDHSVTPVSTTRGLGTTAFEQELHDADALVQSIVKKNSGSATDQDPAAL
ncbi:membrane fusion protein, multidrug efflux system [Pseudoxanthomonas sp. GM95]|uniref:HlyD family secretion protein n=1 Tax=Pseudoxanthomonas sp. GM95 TaxID=1881043 RepID=UPI0008BEDD0A|nr:HlyD family efflux transporter periplasmic adaptor subunit [Pseudoxanthomonas sp. GM95]SEM53883.1 membrane fusion protein, multidrug efflux system [Pseudoxanthomonas sp. GM95]